MLFAAVQKVSFGAMDRANWYWNSIAVAQTFRTARCLQKLALRQ
jgi:hypothetical protein